MSGEWEQTGVGLSDAAVAQVGAWRRPRAKELLGRV